MSRHDVAIYSPRSGWIYDRRFGRSGGAERQMTLLARTLATRDYRVGLIVYRPHDPIDLPDRHPTLVERMPYAGDRAVVGRLLEADRIWRALRAADGEVVIVREAGPVVAVAALFAKTRRRQLIFSSANNSNFVPGGTGNWVRRAIYGLGVRRANVVVVQTQEQAALARAAFPSLRRVVHIPSFAELASDPARASGEPGSFLWIGRAVDEKQPRQYLELALAVPEARFAMIPVSDRRSLHEAQAIRAAAEGIPNLEVLDPVSHEQLMGLVERSVAVVNTSTFEGMPNVFLEAWAHGVPVLTLRCDPDRVVELRRLGLAAGGSWDRFVDGARELWRGRLDREELARRTRAYVEEVHSVDAVAERWTEVIDSLRTETRTGSATRTRPPRSVRRRGRPDPGRGGEGGDDTLVLCYHAVSERWPAELSVTPERFRRQLELLLHQGYRGATFHDAATSPRPGQTLVVTFDDGFSSVLELAYPILASLGLPATVFVVTELADGRLNAWQGVDSFLGGPHEHELRGLTWSQLAELADAGWEVGSHTRRHPRLTRLGDDELAEELRASREACEAALGRPCRSLAYPYGDVDDRVIAAARAAGYTAAAALPAPLTPAALLAWPRVGVYHDDGLLRFRLKVSRPLRRLRTALAPVEGLARGRR